jgi:CubicO group peptidase (beta-lactamase class C family)
MMNRVDLARNGVGLIACISGPEGRRYISYGRISRTSDDDPGPGTMFELGSITKVFTSLLLADMVDRGEVRLDDPVAMYLPKGVVLPSRNGKQITLTDLATHSSGLPRDADNLDLMQVNPLARYGPSQLYEFLARYTLSRDPGEKFGYSNLAVSLLGHALTLRAGKSYEELLRTRILEPLGMQDTFCAALLAISRPQSSAVPQCPVVFEMDLSERIRHPPDQSEKVPLKSAPRGAGGLMSWAASKSSELFCQEESSESGNFSGCMTRKSLRAG